jgi:hypothetical protein
MLPMVADVSLKAVRQLKNCFVSLEKTSRR